MTEPIEAGDIPDGKLYTVNQVFGASFLGSPVAGGYLMFRNSQVLKDSQGGRNLAVGFVLTVLTMLIAFHVSTSAIAIAGVVAMLQFAKTRQGLSIEDHRQRGGAMQTRGRALGIGLLFLVLVLGTMFGGVAVVDQIQRGTLYSTHSGEEIYFRKGATKDDASKLDTALRTMGFFTGSGAKTVFLSREGTDYHVGFVVKDSAVNEPSTAKVFRAVGDKISSETFGNAVVKVDLYDTGSELKKSL